LRCAAHFCTCCYRVVSIGRKIHCASMACCCLIPGGGSYGGQGHHRAHNRGASTKCLHSRRSWDPQTLRRLFTFQTNSSWCNDAAYPSANTERGGSVTLHSTALKIDASFRRDSWRRRGLLFYILDWQFVHSGTLYITLALESLTVHRRIGLIMYK